MYGALLVVEAVSVAEVRAAELDELLKLLEADSEVVGLAELLNSVLWLDELLDSAEAEADEEVGAADVADSLVAGEELVVSLVWAADDDVATSEVEDSVVGTELDAAEDELSRTGPLEVAVCPELVDEAAAELELYEPYGG